MQRLISCFCQRISGPQTRHILFRRFGLFLGQRVVQTQRQGFTKKSTAQTSYCTYSVAHYILLSAHEKSFMVKLAEFSKKTLTTVSQSVPLKSKQFEKADMYLL